MGGIPKHNHNPKLLDCTLRDGGLVNDSKFTKNFAQAIYKACTDANIDIIEVGFKNSTEFFSPKKFGKLRFCHESVIRDFFGNEHRNIKISVLADVGKTEILDFLPKEESIIDIVRTAFYEHQIDDAIEIIEATSDLGYQTAACMMAAPEIEKKNLIKCVEKIAKSSADIIYLMDSFGSIIPSKLEEIAPIYVDACKSYGKTFAIHSHNNLQCAFANTLLAIALGAEIADCSIGGLGKGAGNCNSELLAGRYKGVDSAVKLAQTAEQIVMPMQANYRWGFSPQFMLTGFMGLHPRIAAEYSALNNPPPIEDFYDKIRNQSK